MNRDRVYGVMPACITVWNGDQSFDRKGMERYISWLLDKGVQCISVCGSTGENIAMTMEEQKAVIETAVRFVDGQVPVYAGTGRYTTLHTVELSKFAQSVGADGLMVILPYYLKPYKKAVYEHFREVRRALGPQTDLMIYNNPWFAGYELDPREIKMLNDEGTIGAIKAAHGDVNRVHNLKYACGDKLKVFYGHDYSPMEALLGGADGWLSGVPAAFPKFARTLYDICAVEKNVDKARAYWNKFQPYIDYFHTFTTGYPHWLEIFKYVINAQGIAVGLPRKPLGELDQENKKKLDEILAGMSDVL